MDLNKSRTEKGYNPELEGKVDALKGKKVIVLLSDRSSFTGHLIGLSMGSEAKMFAAFEKKSQFGGPIHIALDRIKNIEAK